MRNREENLYYEMIESVVLDWLNKYPLEAGNLKIDNFEDGDQIRNWITGVWGRITHQLQDSGFGPSSADVVALAARIFHKHLKDYKHYSRLAPFLPKVKND